MVRQENMTRPILEDGDGLTSRYCILMCSHNRKRLTLRCLESLYRQEPKSFHVILVDDGSTDGTAEAVEREFSEVEIVPGTGDLFWSGAMRVALDRGLRAPYDAYIWLNDDVELDPDALARLQRASDELPRGSLLGGSMRSSADLRACYGGSLKGGVNPFRFELIQPSESASVEVDVLHGNLLFVPRRSAELLGNLPDYLLHLGGDYEYCLRASRQGIRRYIAPGTFGRCDPNLPEPTQRGFKGLRRILSPKRLPFKPTLSLYRSHGGPLWPIWIVAPYIKAFLAGCE
jgi:GT2 family glycosyltransferase